MSHFNMVLRNIFWKGRKDREKQARCQTMQNAAKELLAKKGL